MSPTLNLFFEHCHMILLVEVIDWIVYPIGVVELESLIGWVMEE